MDEAIRNALVLLIVAILGGVATSVTARVTALNAVAKQEVANKIEREKIKTETDEQLLAERKARLDNEQYIRGLLDRQLANTVKLEDENERLRTNIQQAQTALTAAQDTIDKLTHDSAEAKRQVEAFERNLAAVNAQAEARETELHGLAERFMALNNDLATLRTHINTVEAERDRLVETVTHKNGELAERDRTISELRKQLEDMRGNVEGLQARIQTLENRLKGYEQPTTPPDPPPESKSPERDL